MRNRDTFDAWCGMAAVLGDALAVYGGFMLAVWIRFHSGWIAAHARLAGEWAEAVPPMRLYLYGGAMLTVVFLLLFQGLGLYVRPQTGVFADRVPRIIRGTGWGILVAMALTFVIRTDPPFSRIVALIAFGTVLWAVLLQRFILFRLEIHYATYFPHFSRVAVIGVDHVAARLRDALRREPRLRARVTAFLRTSDAPPDPSIDPALIRGGVDELEALVDAREVDAVILADTDLRRDRMAQLLIHCERGMVNFSMVPDLFNVLTGQVEVRQVGEVPLIGLRRWPLDRFWNRLLKRMEDVVGAVVGLLLSAPAILVAAIMIKRESAGPIFYRQTRCGEGGRAFTIYKLRTMRADAEAGDGPGWTVENDPRRTRVGGLLRQWNIDELPQFWNVLKGEMSLVGPRPERPHYVEQFREEIGRYMWRHASKPGMTGWAQVNGLRGNTSIPERVKYDLYYLENWSLAFDFKILMQTFFHNRNAY